MINPKRHDCTYPDKNLAGVGVALKLVQALCDRAGKATSGCPRSSRSPRSARSPTSCRSSARTASSPGSGSASLSKGPHTIGLRALLDASGLTGKTIDSYQVGFMLAPRVNAAGRMSTPDIATRLLLATDEAMGDEARGAGAAAERREPPAAAGGSRARRAGEEGDRNRPAVGAHNVLVVGGDGWHRGVIGIAASKLVDAYHKPAIVLSIDGDVAHGSCRSIPAFDMLAALERCADLFVRFGGHKQAAGLTMEAARVPEFRARDQRLRRRACSSRTSCGRGCASTARCTSRRSPTTWSRPGRRWAPFGLANPRPVFHAGPRRDRRRPAPIKDRHLKMTFSQDGRRFRAHRVARRRARRVPRPSTAPASTWPSRSTRTNTRARPISSSRSPTSRASTA